MRKCALFVLVVIALVAMPAAAQELEQGLRHIRVHGMIIPFDESLGPYPALAASEACDDALLQRFGLEKTEATRLWTTLNQDRATGKWSLDEIRAGDQIWVQPGDEDRTPVYKADCCNRQFVFAASPTEQQLAQILSRLDELGSQTGEIKEGMDELRDRIPVDPCTWLGQCTAEDDGWSWWWLLLPLLLFGAIIAFLMMWPPAPPIPDEPEEVSDEPVPQGPVGPAPDDQDRELRERAKAGIREQRRAEAKRKALDPERLKSFFDKAVKGSVAAREEPSDEEPREEPGPKNEGEPLPPRVLPQQPQPDEPPAAPEQDDPFEWPSLKEQKAPPEDPFAPRPPKEETPVEVLNPDDLPQPGEAKSGDEPEAPLPLLPSWQVAEPQPAPPEQPDLDEDDDPPPQQRKRGRRQRTRDEQGGAKLGEVVEHNKKHNPRNGEGKKK
jgi:hypothetical protein